MECQQKDRIIKEFNALLIKIIEIQYYSKN